MIRKLYSNLPSFKQVDFHPGLNLILANKSEGATDKQTRNGAGKSSLVELIHSLLGSELSKTSLLKNKALSSYGFGLELELNGEVVAVQRSGANGGKVYVKYPQIIGSQEPDGYAAVSNQLWVDILGEKMFGITPEMRQLKKGPSFRTMFSYFARSAGGYESPNKVFSQQPSYSINLSLLYLLKLNWKIAHQIEEVRQKEKLIQALKDAAEDGALSEVVGTVDDLYTEILLKQTEIDKLSKELSEFRVLPQYRELEMRVASVTNQFVQLSAEDTVDKEWLVELKKLRENEGGGFSLDKIKKLFQEAKVSFPDLVTKRYEELERFHKSILANRKEHLEEEFNQIMIRLGDRYKLKKELEKEKSEILQTLQSHGALDQHMRLQKKLIKMEADVQTLNEKHRMITSLDSDSADLKRERMALQKNLQLDYIERKKVIDEAIISYSKISEELYDEPGKFIVGTTVYGPKFEYEIAGKKSAGKSKMLIFCFDMMLMKLWANEPSRPTVLIHDSIMFDGVDERQIAKALVLGSKLSKEYNFQYIVTMNSDDLPDMSSYEGFDLSAHKVSVDINDTQNGGLFGIRF
ncbi:MAG: ABC-three component system protein [Flavobacteriales bacterium]